MKRLLMAAAALLLIGAGCGAQTTGNTDSQAPTTSGSVQIDY